MPVTIEPLQTLSLIRPCLVPAHAPTCLLSPWTGTGLGQDWFSWDWTGLTPYLPVCVCLELSSASPKTLPVCMFLILLTMPCSLCLLDKLLSSFPGNNNPTSSPQPATCTPCSLKTQTLLPKSASHAYLAPAALQWQYL